MRPVFARLFIAALLVAPGTAWSAAGRVTFVEGEARLTDARGSRGLVLEDAVEVGNALETGAGAHLEVILADASLIRLDESSRLVLEECGQPVERSWQVTLSLALGSVWSKVTRRLGPDARFEVKTERAVAGVRGTVFVVSAAEEHGVEVFEGEVEVSLRQGTDRAELIRHRVRAAHGLRIDRQGKTGGPAALGEDRRPFLQWIRSRDGARGPQQGLLGPGGGAANDARDRGDELRREERKVRRQMLLDKRKSLKFERARERLRNY